MPPTVRPVKLRLLGDDLDVQQVAELIAMLPALSQHHVQLGEISEPYPNRRGGGVRRYLELYVVDDAGATAARAPNRVDRVPPLARPLE